MINEFLSADDADGHEAHPSGFPVKRAGAVVVPDVKRR